MKQKLNKVYPIDVWGVKQICFNDWINKYHNYFSAAEYNHIYNKVSKIYCESFCKKQYSNELYFIGVSNIKILNGVANSIYDKVNTKRLMDNGYTHVLGKNIIELNHYENGILKRRINYPYTINKFHNITFLYRYLKKKRNNLKISDNKNEVASTVGSESKLSVLYSEMNNIINLPLNTQKYIFKSEGHRFNYNYSEQIGNFIKNLHVNFPFISTEFFIELELKINNKFLESYDLMMRYYYKFGSLKNKKLLINGLGSPLHLLIASAWRIAGGHTLGFTHGNNYANFYNLDITKKDGVGCINELNASSLGEKRLIEQSLIERKTPLNLTKDISYTKNFYKATYENLQNISIVHNKVKKVMVIGSGQNGSVYNGKKYYLALSLLKYEYNIMMHLKNKGYEIIYKAHPERKLENAGFFEGIADKIEYDPFESECFNTDCVIFPDIGTTTFGFSLMTKLPMVVFYFTGMMIFPEVMELLKKRCRIVSASVDNEDNIYFDAKHLQDAINSSIYPIDYDVVHQYAL